jgi:hypothetical protein
MPPTINETINEALLLDVFAIYSDAEVKMLNAVAKRIAKGIKTEGWNESKLKSTQALKKEIDVLLNSANKKAKAKISEGVIEAYKNGVENVKTKKGAHETILDELEIPMNLKMQLLATNGLLDNASFQVLRNSDDVYQKVMAHSTTGLLAGTDTRIQATQKMLNEFASKGITSFVDKAGRSWDLSSYSEMCARTVSSHAALQGHIDRQLEVGEDLVKVSSIGTTCPICARWQGVVLSISGNSPKYHSIEEAKATGLFHPNCKHTLVMHIPELDGVGKTEPLPEGSKIKESERYMLTQQQRGNERKIRYWKKRKALAITPEEQLKCNEKIKYWQHTNLLHCEKYNLRRLYAREGVMTGKVGGDMGNWGVGGNLVDYETLYKDIIGESPKKAFGTFKMNLQLFGNSGKPSYEKWLKEEIQTLDQLDIDKAQMKDANNKAVTPTSLYKKYIGDNPMQDWADVAPYEKGTKEYKSGYAKWLKNQIEEIGVTYKIKPKYVEIHEDIPLEDTKLSATEIYKKYHNGEKPTEAFKKNGGELGTGMTYAKWVETQKKELIKNGITKTVPFGNVTTQKTVNTISQASKAINNAKDVVKQAELDKYKQKLDSKVNGAYDGYLQVKEQMEIFKDKYDEVSSVDDEDLKFEGEKLKLAMNKHLEMVKKKAEKTFGGSSFDYALNKLKDMFAKETDVTMKAHIENQINTYEDVKKEKEADLSIKKKKDEATAFLNSVKTDPDSVSYGTIKTYIKDNIDDADIYNEYLKAHKLKKVIVFKDDIETGLYATKQEINDKKYSLQWKVDHYKQSGDKVKELISKANLEAFEEAEKEINEEKKKAAEKAKKLIESKSGKVTLGRETRFDEGKLVKRDSIYQELDLTDLENLSDQVTGHHLFENSNRRDILGRDRIDGHNHHRGHDIRIKSGLSKEDRELAEAFALAYDEYFNTIKCQDINLAYLNGYDKASPLMKKKIDAINMAIESSELNEPIVLHRFTTPEVMKSVFKTLDFGTIDKDEIFDNDTFISAATGGHPTFGKRNYKMTIQVDKGTHALPSLNHEELEVLLKKGKLQFVGTNKYTSSKPQKLKNYDGTYTNFVGEEVVVRYIEDGKAYKYEEVDANKIDDMLGKDELVKHHTNESKPWISSLSKDERKASDRYTGSWYTEMNNVYRRNDRSDKQVVKLSEDLTTALRRSSTEQPIVLRRGVRQSDLAYMLGFNGDWSKVESHWDEVNKGGYAAEDKGFLSTSPYSSGGFTKDVELRIYCPTGTHAAYVDSISTHRGEKETLLQSGSIYKVHQLKKVGYKTVAYIELLGTD